jgi:hypothetical protein
MKLIALNSLKWNPGLLHVALKEAKGSNEKIELLVENGQFFKTYTIEYHGGEKNPHLERVSGQPDMMQEMLKPLTH